jgi:hypothetical protein
VVPLLPGELHPANTSTVAVTSTASLRLRIIDIGPLMRSCSGRVSGSRNLVRRHGRSARLGPRGRPSAAASGPRSTPSTTSPPRISPTVELSLVDCSAAFDGRAGPPPLQRSRATPLADSRRTKRQPHQRLCGGTGSPKMNFGPNRSSCPALLHWEDVVSVVSHPPIIFLVVLAL